MKQILVVDDNISILKQISAHLESDYEVILAKSGLLALQICMREKPDLILLDIEMPDLNGFEVISRLKQNPYLNRIPVIFLTASHDSAIEVKALESGARDFITKPAERNILLHRIALHLRLTSFQARTEETVKALSDSIAISFAELIECRDENTGGHVMRTSKIVEIIGQYLINNNIYPEELSLSELQLIVRAAPLHDLGKIAISDRILLKASKLDDEEFTLMKRHASIGGEIIERMYQRLPTQHYLYYASLIATSHHERYDGKGYPKGIKGEEIPLCARIMSVADVYDAIISNRVYRSGMSQVQARSIISSSGGTQFDPRVVKAFENTLEELHGQYQSVSDTEKTQTGVN